MSNLRMMLLAPLLLLIHCKAAGQSAAGTASAAPDVSPSAPSAPSASAATTPAASSGGAVSVHLDALAVCNLVVSAKAAQLCETKPASGGAVDAAQFTAGAKPPRYGGVFRYPSRAAYDAELATFKTELAREKAPAPVLVSNDKALTIVVAQGAFPAADLEAVKRIVAGLR